MKKNRALLVFLSSSFLFFTLAICFFSKNPTAALGGWGTDHYSHYMEGILFSYKGFATNKYPARQICPPKKPDTWRTDHDCNIQEREGQRELKINWNIYPRFYPPGNKVYAALESFLYEKTSLSFVTINKIAIIKYLFIAHLLFFFIYTILRDSQIAGWSILRWTVMPLVFLQLIYHSFSGFYDAVGVLFVFLSIYSFLKKKDVDAILLFALGLFFHYRTLWFLPVLALATWNVIHRQGYPVWTKGNIAKASMSAVLMALAAYPFMLMYPHVVLTPKLNPIYWENINLQNFAFFDFAGFAILTALFFFKRKQWLLLAVFLFQVMMFVKTPVARTWYSIYLMPYFAFLVRFRSEGVITLAISLIYLVQTMVVFGQSPFPGQLLSQFLTGNF